MIFKNCFFVKNKKLLVMNTGTTTYISTQAEYRLIEHIRSQLNSDIFLDDRTDQNTPNDFSGLDDLIPLNSDDIQNQRTQDQRTQEPSQIYMYKFSIVAMLYNLCTTVSPNSDNMHIFNQVKISLDRIKSEYMHRLLACGLSTDTIEHRCLDIWRTTNSLADQIESGDSPLSSN